VETYLGGDGGGVRAQQVLHRFLAFEHAPVPDRAEAPFLVRRFHRLVVPLRHAVGQHRVLHEKRVVRVAGRVALRLEQGVEVPKRAFHPLVRGHLLETHLHEDAPELGAHLQKRGSSIKGEG